MKWLKYAGAHLLWLVNALFGIWLLFMSRNTWLAIFNHYYILGSPMRAARANLIDRSISILLGLLWFGMVIAIQPYFSTGAAKGDLLRRFGKSTGPLVLAFSLVDLVLMIIQGAANTGWQRLAVLLLELGLGIVLVWLGRGKAMPAKSIGQASSTD